jgi:hypothetical protein
MVEREEDGRDFNVADMRQRYPKVERVIGMENLPSRLRDTVPVAVEVLEEIRHAGGQRTE